MSLPRTLTDREQDKFEEGPLGETRVRVTTSGTISTSGLSVGGKIQFVTLNDSTWTALPPTPLSNRNGISIQNQSETQIKIHYDNTTVGYIGVNVDPNGERFYDIKDTIILYGKSKTGNVDILIEELA